MPSVPEWDRSAFFKLDGIRYVCRPSILYPKVEFSNGFESRLANVDNLDPDPKFLTILKYDSQATFQASWLQQKLEQSLRDDDVLHEDFLETLLISGALLSDDTAKPVDFVSLLKSWNIGKIEFVEDCSLAGPFLVKDDGRLWQILRLYEDSQGAFLIPVTTSDGETFEVANDGNHGWSSCALAVPSRLSTVASTNKPLAGVRVALKDAIDLRGVRTSLCNRAYLQTYSKATASAEAIQPLLRGGAVVLGKTKLSMFLSREEATESTDFQTTCNPRADGFQSPGGSSSGSAAAVAAYPWIDIGIGSDTNGSIRRPAQCNGVFGLRPSRGAMSSIGLFTIFKHFDVPGVFARSFKKLHEFADSWYIANQPNRVSQDHLPKSVWILEDSLPGDTESQTAMVINVAQDLASHLGVSLQYLNMVERWAKSCPVEAKGESLHDYLREVGASTFLYSNYHSTAAFRQDYFQQFGKKPFVSPFVNWRWSIGCKYSRGEYEEGMARMKVYENWLLKEVLMSGTESVLLVSQSKTVTPFYRDNPPPQYYVQPAWHQWWVASILGAPEAVIPAGQLPFTSRISGKEEFLPVMANILSLSGTDGELLNTISDYMQKSGRPDQLEPGKHMFPPSRAVPHEKIAGFTIS